MSSPKRKPRFSPVGHTGPSADAALPPAPAAAGEPPAEAPAPVPAEQPTPVAADPAPPAASPAPAPAKRAKAARTVPGQPGRRTPEPEPAVPASQTVDGLGSSAFTWRQTLDQVDQLDDLRRAMRRATGNRRLDKATILAALVDLADTDKTVGDALVAYLRRTS